MLKKKDLVKEFELVVKQEIIEHNNSITANNIAMNKLRDKIEEVNTKCSSVSLRSKNDVIYFNNKLREFQVEHEILRNNFHKLKSDQFVLNQRNHKEIQIIDQSIETVYKNQKNNDKRVDSLSETISLIEDGIIELVKHNETESVKTRAFIVKSLFKLKEEILSIPTGIEEVKNEFMKELSMHKIDNEGLLKEIAVLKRTVFVNEKKIENLYTLIDRLKKKLAKE